MSRPNLDGQPRVDSGKKNWDAKINQALDDLEAIIEDGPWPVKTYGIGISLPAASSYDRCILARNDTTLGWHLMISSGIEWRTIPTRSDHVTRLTDSTGGTPGSSLVSTGSGAADNNFASLLAKIDEIQNALEASGVMAGS